MLNVIMGLIAISIISTLAYSVATAPVRAAKQAFSQKLLGKHLKDPESAIFEDVKFGMDNMIVCGRINAKNSFGAYVGFRRFIAKSGGITEIEFEDNNGFNPAYWEGICSKSKS